MSTIARLKSRQCEVLSDYFQLIRLEENQSKQIHTTNCLHRNADEHREVETRAAVRIQACWRGHYVRKHIKTMTGHIIDIQRLWRGYKGRQRFKEVLDQHDRSLRKAYFGNMATRIQRRWRGFFSRKYLHDFYARKAFLASIREKNDAVRKQIQTEYEEALVEQERQVEEEAQTQFRDKIMALHHLVSTSASPGIFNSPFDIVKGTIPTVNGTPVEDWLKMAGRAKAAKLPPLQARRQGPPKLTRKTLRASSQYTAVHDAAILEGLVHTATRRAHHERPFSSSVQPMEPYLSTQSIRNLEPYVDPYDPTIGARKDGFDHEARSISPSPFTSFGLAGECD